MSKSSGWHGFPAKMTPRGLIMAALRKAVEYEESLAEAYGNRGPEAADAHARAGVFKREMERRKGLLARSRSDREPMRLR